MNPRYATLFVLVPILGYIVYELWAVFNKRPNDTISAVVWTWVASSLMIPLLAGLLCGHFFLTSGWRVALSFLIGLAGGASSWLKGPGNHL